MIPKTYYYDDPECRNYIPDLWSWLKEQPQDAWLLWARQANWDNADTIFDLMLDRPDCDLALVSWIFWGCNPDFYVRKAGFFSEGTLIYKIIRNCESDFYRSSSLFCDRYSVAISAHEYLNALRQTGEKNAPFKLPRALCGPFNGRYASLPERYDTQTEQDLEEIFEHIDGALPRSENEYWSAEERGGNLWIKKLLTLPSISGNPIVTYRDLDDAAFIEMIFGKQVEYAAARKQAERDCERSLLDMQAVYDEYHNVTHKPEKE